MKINEKLWEYPDHEVVEATDAILDACMNDGNAGILWTNWRYGLRLFCEPGFRLGLKKDGHAQRRGFYFPTIFQGNPGLDEAWRFNTCVVKTDATLISTGQSPFRECITHVLTPDGKLVSVQELIEVNPGRVIGTPLATFSKSRYGKVTWPVTSKTFDNQGPIPHHMHEVKLEGHDPNPYLNQGVNNHYHYMACGLHPWVTRQHLLRALADFDNGPYNNIRGFSPAVLNNIGEGVMMPNQMLHAPTSLAQDELHSWDDEHLLPENRTAEGKRLTTAQAWGAIRASDYPKDKIGNWEWWVHHRLNWERNQSANWAEQHMLPNLPAPELSGSGYKSHFVLWGLIGGRQAFSKLRILVEPGVSTTLSLPAPFYFEVNKGEAVIGGRKVRREMEKELGKPYTEGGFVTNQGRNAFKVTNESGDQVVLTLDFAEDAFSTTPGLGIDPQSLRLN